MLAAALVTAITGTALPTCRLRAEMARPTSEATRITSASGWPSTARPWSVCLLSALIDTSEAPQIRPAEAARRVAPRALVRAAVAASRPRSDRPPT